MLPGLVAPRFDSPGEAIANVVGMAVLLGAVLLLLHRRRAGAFAPSWAWAMCLAHLSINGIYLPIGPALVMVMMLSTRPEPPSTNALAAPPR